MARFLERMQAIIRDRDNLIEIANRCDRAYAEGTGNPDWYTPFGEEQSEKVAQNSAGPQAVMAGVGIIALLRGVSLGLSGPQIMLDIVNGDLDEREMMILLRLANCAWGAGQPFRTDKGPLGRAGAMNMFDLLDHEEVEKDYHQVRAAAQFFLEKLS
jgi:hypothetical protein